jgi:hypothetical protein
VIITNNDALENDVNLDLDDVNSDGDDVNWEPNYNIPILLNLLGEWGKITFVDLGMTTLWHGHAPRAIFNP